MNENLKFPLRVGRNTGMSILDNESKLVAMCRSAEEAKLIVDTMNQVWGSSANKTADFNIVEQAHIFKGGVR